MKKLTFTLKQHTPLIHFQPDQHGATLRASEVKPRLDRFILEKLGGGHYNAGAKIAQKNNWLIKGAEYPALEYKIAISPNNNPEEKIVRYHKNSPMYFGNMGKENPDKQFKLIDETIVTIRSFNSELVNEIHGHISQFFLHNNFGTRQSKGYGSFYLTDESKYPIDERVFDYKFNFTISKYFNINNYTIFYTEVFTKIKWFYSALRGGLNVKSQKKDNNNQLIYDSDNQVVMNDDFYFKSLLFLYFKCRTPSIQWEKKTIKEKFFLNTERESNGSLIFKGLNDQLSERENIDDFPLNFSTDKKRLVRDLLGLSTEEQWLSYKDTITKTEAKQDEHGDWKSKSAKDPTIIQRNTSPIFLKPIIKQDICTVYIGLDKVLLTGKTFIIKNKNNQTFPLTTPNNFDLHDFFDFILNSGKFNIENHVENINGYHERPEFIFLKDIFSNLSKI